MKKTLSIILTLSLLTATAQQLHVRPTATGDGTGSSWSNATTLEHAVSVATTDQAIWVQAGTYNLTATLVVSHGVRLYGGFAGNETELRQRNFAKNPTIIDANNLFAAVTLDYTAVLNGFTVQNGVANSPTRMNGGGVLMRAGSRLENSYILNNIAANLGGGVFVESHARIFNSVIAYNKAGVSGFAVSGEEVEFFSNTVTNNMMLDCEIYATATFFDTICAGETLTLTASRPGTYLWSTGATSATITTTALTASTTITVTITTQTFCVVTDTFEITVNAPPTLVLTSGEATLNQIVGMGPLIIPITFERGGSATEVEIFWSWPGTENSTTAPTGIEVSHLAEDTIVITGNLDTFVNNDTIRFRISTVATASCPPLDTIMGVFARTNFCNTATPNWVREQNPDLGWIRWGGSANTDANNDIESGTTLIFGTDGRTSQVWSGAVFAQACGWRGIQFNGGQHGVLNFSADCRHASPALTGNLFSWCAVYRFGDQLCPDGWRVPTAEDFLVLHQNLGFELPNPLGLFIEHGNEGHFMPIEGTSGAPQIGGAWGGARFTGLTDLVDAPSSDYWSSSESWTGLSRRLYFNNVHVWPYRTEGKQVGKTVRCVRDTVLPVTQGCNQNLPNWGVLGLGTITWGNTTNTDVSEGATVILGTDGRSDQLWSGAVFASACNKTAFNGGTTGNFTADCRQTYFSVTNRSTGQQGDLFSWCAVMRFGHLLCPEDWRVPTQQDFINLDLNIGGTGQNRSNVPESVARFVGSTGTAREPQISGIWQGTRWTGWTTSPSTNQGSVYWSSNEASAINAFNLSLNPSATNPQNSNPKNIGYALRCVRDVP